MPPETKQIISKLEEMTCKNCIYSVIITREKHYAELDGDYDCHQHFSPCVLGGWHCSKGKWLTGRLYTADFASELSVEDYDDCYYQIVRAQEFPGGVSYADEYNARRQVLSILDEYIARDSTRVGFDGLPLGPNTELAKIKELLVKLWGEQE